MPNLPPVPDCEGPQLHPYQSNGTADIIFLEEIGKGLRGCVFKVQINNKLFALKVFYYEFPDETWVTVNEELWHKIDAKLVEAQWLPFHAECRAYARLKETEKEHLAVRCYGYLCLTEAQKKQLEEQFGIESWWNDNYNFDSSDPDTQREFQQQERLPLRAIVKELISSDANFGPEHALMMTKDLHQLHRVGIINNDLKEDAYIDGKLVDFSEAIVVPHIKLDIRLRQNLDDLAREFVCEDLASLRATFVEWNEEHEEGPKIACNSFGGLDTVSRLRRGSLTRNEYIARCFNPRRIKWRRFSAHVGGSVKTQHAECLRDPLKRGAAHVRGKTEPDITIKKKYIQLIQKSKTSTKKKRDLEPDMAIFLKDGTRTSATSLVMGDNKCATKWSHQSVSDPDKRKADALWPLRQILTYCIEGKTRYGWIMTTSEVVVFRMSQNPSSTTLAVHFLEWTHVPWSNSGEGRLTVNLAIWWLGMMSLAEKHRAIVYPNKVLPINSWRKTKAKDGTVVYIHQLSGRVLKNAPSGQYNLINSA